jgi:hypothetical protein
MVRLFLCALSGSQIKRTGRLLYKSNSDSLPGIAGGLPIGLLKVAGKDFLRKKKSRSRWKLRDLAGVFCLALSNGIQCGLLLDFEMSRGLPDFRAVGFSKPEACVGKSFNGGRDARPTTRRSKVGFPNGMGSIPNRNRCDLPATHRFLLRARAAWWQRMCGIQAFRSMCP